MLARLLSVVLLTFLGTSGTEVPKSPFSVAVVPTTQSGERGMITMANKETREFFVVLTNISTKPQPIFEDWNSWGYQTISFELTTSRGKKVLLSRRQQDFTKNGASTFIVQPREHQVFAIRLGQWWETKPALRKVNDMPITLKVIYEVSPSPEAITLGVWTGRLESHQYKVILRQW